MKYLRFSMVLCVLLAAAGLSAAPAAQDGTLSVTITPGVSWKTDRTPQFAVWVERPDGTYVTTLYVTERAAKKNWLFAPKNGRPESLPVWYHAVNNSAVIIKSQPSEPSADAVTSATPGAAELIQKSIRLPSGGQYVVKVEVNHSFDYNESWPKNAKKGTAGYSGVNGQPSIVYAAVLSADSKPVSVQLAPAGTGAVDGKDGAVHAYLAQCTTALQIVGGIEAAWSLK